MERGSGILMHISSLPSPYGIGTMGRAAYDFVDFLASAGQKYWQVLPISPTGFGDSPYQSYSTFAGNPYFIDLDMLSEYGGLHPDEYRYIDFGNNPDRIDYEKIVKTRIHVLESAYNKDKHNVKTELDEFRARESYWIENYAMFMSVKQKMGGLPYWEWDNDIKRRNPDTISRLFLELEDKINFWVYVQYRFFEQWNRLKSYANSKGIKIIGDIPIYVAEDSVDAWAHNEILQLDHNRRPINVAGCPPDYFSPRGQLWGNPLYDWEYLKTTNYEWWVLRICAALKMCDIVRIDHFRGFSAYYSIPFGDEDATGGKWVDGPGEHFFDTLKGYLGENPPIIAEDLGLLDDKVISLLKYTKFPGMKVLQFAFEPNGKSTYLPHKYDKNCVAYIGTHDNDTLLGWYGGERDDIKNFANDYLRINGDLTEGMISCLLSSVADIAVITMQDILKLGSDARMNTPGKNYGNWQWRLANDEVFKNDTAHRLAKITQLYGR